MKMNRKKRIEILKSEIKTATNPSQLGQLYALLHKEQSKPRRMNQFDLS